MKHEKPYAPTFIPYDDENLEHVMAGPDYGQPDNSGSYGWTELDSIEYEDYVNDMISKILKTHIKL